MKSVSYILVLFSIYFFSCKKDVEVETTVKPLKNTYEGSYKCTEIISSVTLDTAGHIGHTVDTISNMIITVTKQPDNSYNVNTNVLLFNSGTSVTNTTYYPQCPTGPCPTLKFCSTDSIYIYTQSRNINSYFYYGKKQ